MADMEGLDRSPVGRDRRPSLIDAPEFPVVVFSFLLHFVWEFVQAPAYAGMVDIKHWDGIRLCISATFGDAGFALAAFWAASLSTGSRNWIGASAVVPKAVFIGVGIALTVAFEYYYTRVNMRWTYSELMLIVPPFGTGLSPLLQWIIIPPAVLWLTNRHLAGSRAIGAKS